jgi:hypothetical protein
MMQTVPIDGWIQIVTAATMVLAMMFLVGWLE